METTSLYSDRDKPELELYKDAGSWLEAIPTEDALTLKPSDFHLAASLRLGIPPPFVHHLFIGKSSVNMASLLMNTILLLAMQVWRRTSVAAQ